jgi:hypothetical protein
VARVRALDRSAAGLERHLQPSRLLNLGPV